MSEVVEVQRCCLCTYCIWQPLQHQLMACSCSAIDKHLCLLLQIYTGDYLRQVAGVPSLPNACKHDLKILI